MPAINWDDLHAQKKELVALIWDKPDSSLWGIVHLLDVMQDLAVEAGRWEFPPSEEDDDEA